VNVKVSAQFNGYFYSEINKDIFIKNFVKKFTGRTEIEFEPGNELPPSADRKSQRSIE
jgi:hypothetical protein